MQFEIYLVRAGIVSAEQFVDALDLQQRSRPVFGRLALETRKLTVHQVAEVLQRQCDVDKPFGETAVDLGFLTRRQVTYLLKTQKKRTPALIDCLVRMDAVEEELLEEYREQFRAHMAEYGDVDVQPLAAVAC